MQGVEFNFGFTCPQIIICTHIYTTHPFDPSETVHNNFVDHIVTGCRSANNKWSYHGAIISDFVVTAAATDFSMPSVRSNTSFGSGGSEVVIVPSSMI